MKTVWDPSFALYGKVIKGYETAELLEVLEKVSEKPENEVIYVPSCAALEELPIFGQLQNGFYGGMPIQIGYCNGSNTKLNCLEYHRDSEVDIAADDVILLLAREQDIENKKLSTDKVEAFLAPKGTAVELYATTLHYAPCNAKAGSGFRVVIVLPRGTNLEKPDGQKRNDEDHLLWASNKWLLAHADSAEAKQGAYVGLEGENIDLLDRI